MKTLLLVLTMVFMVQTAHAIPVDEAPGGNILVPPAYNAASPCDGAVWQWLGGGCPVTRNNTGYLDDAYPAAVYLWKTDCSVLGQAYCNGGGFLVPDNAPTAGNDPAPVSDPAISVSKLERKRAELNIEVALLSLDLVDAKNNQDWEAYDELAKEISKLAFKVAELTLQIEMASS